VASTVHRKLTFYVCHDVNLDEPFDRLAAAADVKDLEGTPDEIFDDDGSLIAVLVHNKGTKTSLTRFKLLPLRDYDNRPLRYRPGIAPSPIRLRQGEYTSDITHVAIWPDGYAAYDAHGHAPGPSKLAAYLKAKCGHRVDFVALYDRGLIDRLKALDGLTSVDFSITRPDKAQRAADSKLGVFAGLRSARQGLEEVSFGTRISVGRTKDRRLDDGLQADILELVPQAEDYFDSLRVTGVDKRTGERVEINVLQTRVHRAKDLARAKSGGDWPDSGKCFSALEDAKREIGRKELEQAVRARPKPQPKSKK
jgi:hypothetical protein